MNPRGSHEQCRDGCVLRPTKTSQELLFLLTGVSCFPLCRLSLNAKSHVNDIVSLGCLMTHLSYPHSIIRKREYSSGPHGLEPRSETLSCVALRKPRALGRGPFGGGGVRGAAAAAVRIRGQPTTPGVAPQCGPLKREKSAAAMAAN